MPPCRIYIVEDHPVMRQAYADVIALEADLELCGAAGSAEEALAVLEAPGPAVCDVLIVDVSLPGMSGLELVKRLQAIRPDLPALVISGHGSAVFEAEALRAGARAYVSKSKLAGTFSDAIRGVFRGGSQSEPNRA